MKAKHPLALVFFPAFDWAISPTHPEREERLLYTQDQIFEEGLFDIEGIVEYKPAIATRKDIQRVHFCVPDEEAVTTESHLISAGGAITVAESVMNKKVEKGFALVRPPGHHSMRVVHGARGFCNINIEAIMVEYLRDTYGIDRVAIVDTDCHHGDGTQDIYWHDPDTLYISIHQDGRTLYPGSGFQYEMGGPNALGTTINIPLPPKTSEEGFLYALEEVILPALDDFKPELIINSAGQDNHYTDPITNMNFSAQGYAKLTKKLGAHVAVLEGGYSIEGALPYVNLGIILAMAGLNFDHVLEPDYDHEKIRQPQSNTDYIKELCDEINEYRQNIKAMAPRKLSGGETKKRNRQIYYDTDNISERQEEEVMLCDRCAGALRIDSHALGRKRICAVLIPRKACKQCRETGYRWFDQADRRTFDFVYLQDRVEGNYLVR